jgi:hypothetical protein
MVIPLGAEGKKFEAHHESSIIENLGGGSGLSVIVVKASPFVSGFNS